MPKPSVEAVRFAEWLSETLGWSSTQLRTFLRTDLASNPVPDHVYRRWRGSPGFTTSEDVHAAHKLWDALQSNEVHAWGRLLPYHHAYPVPVVWNVALADASTLARQLPRLAPEQFFAAMLSARTQGLGDPTGWPFWAASGVLRAHPPHVDPTMWPQWRQTAIATCGITNAAICAAAGLDPADVMRMHRDGTLHMDSLTMLATLNVGAPAPTIGVTAHPR